MGQTYNEPTMQSMDLKCWPAPDDHLRPEDAMIILRHMGHLCFLVPMRYQVYLALHVYTSIARHGLPSPIFIRCIRVFTLTELKVDMEYNVDHIRMFFNAYKRYFLRSTTDEFLGNICKRCKHLLLIRHSPKLMNALDECVIRRYGHLK